MGDTPQAIISFQPPFTHTITLISKASLPNQLHFTYWPGEWSVLEPNADRFYNLYPETSLHIKWDQTASSVTYDWRNAKSETLQPGNKALSSSTNLATSIAAQSTPASVSATVTPQSASSSQDIYASTTTTQPRPSARPMKDGMSAGAVAGIAIGCFAIGALIAGIILWFLWKRRKPARNLEQEAIGISLIRQEKGYSTHNAYNERENPASTPISSPLPLPLEDKAISAEVSKIGNSIKNHVQSYYYSGRVSPGNIDYDDVQALGENLPISAGTLSTLLSDSATREIALRFCIAWVICGKMIPRKDSESSLLPLEVAQSLRRMADINAASRSKLLVFRIKHDTD